MLRGHISTEAHHRCEYCQTSRRLIGMPLVIDHIIPRSAGGSNARENLVLLAIGVTNSRAAKPM